MPRSAPSAADRALIEELARRDVSVSPYQLERWRSWGLIPRPTVHWLGARGSAVELHPDTVEAAEWLGIIGGRGKSRVAMTAWLVAIGYLPSLAAVVPVLAQWLEKADRYWRRKLEEACAELATGDAEGDALDVAEAVVRRIANSRVSREMLRLKTWMVIENSPHLSSRQAFETARSMMTWEIAQLAGEILDHDLKALDWGFDDPAGAPEWVDTPDRPNDAESQTLATLTWAETVVALRYRESELTIQHCAQGGDPRKDPDVFGRTNFLASALLSVTWWRWYSNRDPAMPVSDEVLTKITRQFEAELAGWGVGVRPSTVPGVDEGWPDLSNWRT